jgi:hypothetical protein
MRVFLLTLGTRGDFELFFSLGCELRRRGHSVLLGSSSFYAERVAAAGLTWAPMGDSRWPTSGCGRNWPRLQKTSAQEKASQPAQDRIEVRQDGDASIVDVYRVKGIGGAQVKAPASGWPPAVVVRLHDFPALESFKATSKGAGLDCALTRAEGQPAANRCTLGGAVVDAVRKDAGYYEVTLPEELLTTDGGVVELRWVDQWR